MDDLIYWIWFSNLANYRNQLIRKLFLQVKNPKLIYEMQEKQLKEYKFLNFISMQKLLNKDLENAIKIYEMCKINNYNIITYYDIRYSEKLKNIDDFPYLLYHRGKELFLDEKLTIGIVGTRKPSAYGESVARNISMELSKKGVIIVSGMAEGIDAMGHYGAVDVGMPTVAVLGTGIDKPYPYKNKDLYDYMVEYGSVYSEFPPDAKCYPSFFPQRNRIISGLSMGLLVVEAPTSSGSLITANMALNQGKDVFTVPNLITNKVCQGSNDLIKEGAAKCISCIDDILEEYSHLYKFNETQSKSEKKDVNNNIVICEFINNLKDLSPLQMEIVKVMCDEFKSIDEIAEMSKIPIQIILGEMTIFEMQNIVISAPGKKFKLNINK